MQSDDAPNPTTIEPGACDGPVVVSSLAQGVAVLTLNRPSAINAANDALRQALGDLLARLDADPAVAVIVVRGAGPRGFCVGADIKEMRGPEPLEAIRARMARPTWIEALDRVAKVTIASVHGFCLGGGMELALACDIRIAASDSTFGLPEVNLGLMPGGGGTQRLTRLIGAGRAFELMATGDRIDARRALDLGIVTHLSDSHETLVSDTAALAAKIAAKPALAPRYIKEAVRGARDLALGEGLRLEKDLFTMLMGTEERIAASAAFAARSRTTERAGQ